MTTNIVLTRLASAMLAITSSAVSSAPTCSVLTITSPSDGEENNPGAYVEVYGTASNDIYNISMVYGFFDGKTYHDMEWSSTEASNGSYSMWFYESLSKFDHPGLEGVYYITVVGYNHLDQQVYSATITLPSSEGK